MFFELETLSFKELFNSSQSLVINPLMPGGNNTVTHT